MRSTRRADAGQGALWDEPDAAAPEGTPPVSARTRRRPRTTTQQPVKQLAELVLRGNEFARVGWPAGTVLHLTPATRASRGDLVVMRAGARTLVGRLALDRGRPALRTAAGSVWLPDGARVIALVTAIEAPLVV